MELFQTIITTSTPSTTSESTPKKNPNEGVTTNVELIEKPILKSHLAESPEDPDIEKRRAFYSHKCHFFIFTTAGKPIFTRYGDEYSVASLCASYAAIIPKLQCMYSDQVGGSTAEGTNPIRYIKTKDMLIVFMLRKNLVYLCIHKGDRGYSSIHRQLEYLHIQVPLFFRQFFHDTHKK